MSKKVKKRCKSCDNLPFYCKEVENSVVMRLSIRFKKNKYKNNEENKRYDKKEKYKRNEIVIWKMKKMI